jgi:hypothetical protein
MKLPFRFFRGEFNGPLLYKALICFNDVVKDILDELAYQATFQWKSDMEASPGETAIRDDDLFNIGKIAGLHQDSLLGRTTLGSIAFAPSYIVDGRQRSERGLMDMNAGAHRFVRTGQDEYPDDISDDASADLRAGFVPEGAEPVGYVPEGTPAYNVDGSTIWENILSDPPSDGTPYVPFYGEKYLAHEETFVKDSPLSPDMFKKLLECMIKIRREGPTLWSFFEATAILVTGVVMDIEIVPVPGRHYKVYYSIDPDSSVIGQDRLVLSWLWVCKDKFKLFIPEMRAA